MARIINPITGEVTETEVLGRGMQPPPEADAPQSGLLRRVVGDPLVTAAKAVVAVPEMLVGLANIPTMGYAGKAAEGMGVRFKDTQQILSDLYSTQMQAAEQKVQEAKGFTGTIGAMLSEPAYTLHRAAEMVPQMLAGGAVGRAVTGGAKAAQAAQAAGTGLQHAVKAAAIGEGITAAGANTEQLRQQTDDGTLTPGQVATQVAAGVTTGLIGFGAGKLATKMGFTDADVLAAGGRATLRQTTAGGRAAAIGKGVVQEGVLEELPQSAQEQMWTNVALDRPVLEGVPEAAGAGVVLGGVMGGTVAGTMQNNKVADAAAAVQILARPPESGDTTQHEQALKAVADLVGHFSPERKTDLAKWRLEQMGRIGRGEAVDYTAVPEFAPESELRASVDTILSNMHQRRMGTEATTDDFGNVVEAQLPRPFTPEQRAQYEAMQAALGSRDPTALLPYTGRIAVPAFQPATTADPALELQTPPAVIPPAAPTTRTTEPLLQAMETTWPDAALRSYIAQQEASENPDLVGVEQATRVLMAREAGDLPRPAVAVDPKAVVRAVSTDMKAFSMRGGRRATAETFAEQLAKGDVAAAEAMVQALDAKFDPAGKTSDAQAAFIESLNRHLPQPLPLRLGDANATQPAAPGQTGAQPQPAPAAPDAQAAGRAGQTNAQGNAAAQPAQEAQAQGVAPNAVQESSPAPADVLQAPANGAAVGGRNTQGQAAAPKTGNAKAPSTQKTQLIRPTPEVAGRQLAQLAPADVQDAAQAWELRRGLEARRKGVPKDGFYAVPWDQLPVTAQAMWAASERSAEEYRQVKQEMQQVRAADTAERVGSAAAAVQANAKKAIYREAETEAIAAKVLQHYKMSPGERKAQMEGEILAEYAKHMRLKGKAAKSLSIAEVQDALFTNIAEHVKSPLDRGNPFVSGERRPIVEALVNASETEDGVPFLLDAIAQAEMSMHKELVGMATLLREVGTSGVRIEYIDERRTSESGLPKHGNYNAATNTIEIYHGGETAHVILHEVAHALTVHQLQEAIKERNAGRRTQRVVALKELEALFKYVQDANVTPFGMQNIAEFTAEVLSRVELQRALRSLDAPPAAAKGKPWYKTVYDGFVEGARKLLGLSPSKRTALDAAIDLTGRFLTPNTKDAPVVSEGVYDATATPAAALTLPFAAAGRYIGSVERWLGKPLTTAKSKLRKAANYLSSTKHIMRRIAHDTALKPLTKGLNLWFKADQDKTAVMKMVGDEMYGHAREVELLAAKTKNPLKTNQLLGWLFSEASRLNIDLRRNYLQNAAADADPGRLAPLKDDINKLHAEYVRLGQQPHGKALIALGHKGVRLNRKSYAMQATTLVLSMLRSHRAAGQGRVAATDILTRFEKSLDILQDAAKLKNSDAEVFADGLHDHLHKQLQALFAYIDQHYPSSDLAQDVVVAKQFYDAAWANPYMHLGRHGMYTVQFDVADNGAATVAKLNQLLGGYGKALGPFVKDQHHVFMRVETLYEANEIFQLLSKQPNLIRKDDEGRSTLRAGAISEAASLDNAFGLSRVIRALKDRMSDRYAALGKGQTPAVKAAFDQAVHALNEALIDMLEVNSARKANLRRTGAPGYDSDYLRNFSKRAQWAASMVSNQYATDTFAEAFREMQATIGDLQRTNPEHAVRGQELYDELAIRHGNALNPVDSPVIDRARAMGYNFYLALSPAFLITNLMQPYHLALPLLGAKFGFVRTAKEMGKAAMASKAVIQATIGSGWKEGKGRGVLDARLDLSKAKVTAEERKFIDYILRAGVVDATAAHELGRLAEGESSTAATTAKVLSLFSHYSEIHNRLTAGIAAFRMASGDFDHRTSFAIETIEKTQFNYSDHNTARALGRHGFAGKITPLLTAFQQYAFQTMEHYIRLATESVLKEPGATAARQKEIAQIRSEARKALAATFVATSLIAGTMGLPFATVLAALANAAGDDDKDVRERYREWLAEVFGPEMGEIIAKGATRTLGIDMSARAGHQDLIPGSRFLADRRHWDDKLKDQNKTMLGPALNAGMDIASGLSHVADGDVVKGIEAALPLAVRGLYKAGTVVATGGYTNKAGNAIPLDLNNWDLFVQALAFTPAKKAEQSEASFYYQSAQAVNKRERASLRARVVKALEAGDMTPELVAEVEQYNVEHPGEPLTGVKESLRTRAAARAAAYASGTGILEANRKYFPSISERSWANTGIAR